MIMYWHGIDLKWAYSDLLPSIHKQTYCKHAAYDVLHDALVRFALTKNPNRHQQPHAYLQVIVRNLLIDDYKSRSRYVQFQDEVDFIDGNKDDSTSMTGFYPSTEHIADINQRIQALQILIEHLPSRCREVFWLFKIEGISQAEIASQLGITQNAVEKHMIRAMKKLLEANDHIGLLS